MRSLWAWMCLAGWPMWCDAAPRGGKSLSGRCDIEVAAGGNHLADAVSRAATGARLCLQPGEHAAGFAIDRSLTLVGVAGADKTTLRAAPHTAVLRVDDDGLAVRLEGLTLTGGEADAGGGLRIQGRGKVQVVDCQLTGNRAVRVGGGGLYASAGLLELTRTRIDHNQGVQGGGVWLDQTVRAELSRVTVEDNQAELGGGLRITEGVQADCKLLSMRRNGAEAVRVSGTRSRKPKVVIDHAQVDDGQLVQGPEIPGDITLKSSRVPATWKSQPSVRDGQGNQFNP